MKTLQQTLDGEILFPTEHGKKIAEISAKIGRLKMEAEYWCKLEKLYGHPLSIHYRKTASLYENDVKSLEQTLAELEGRAEQPSLKQHPVD